MSLFMKILFITHKFYPEIGGIEVNSEILSLAFHNAGHEVKLVTWTVDQTHRKYPFTIARNPGFFKLLQLHHWAEVVFENNPSLRLSWPSFFSKKPLVVAIRTWINRMDGTISWQDKLKIYGLKKADAVIAISDSVRKKTLASAVVIGNPYRQELFKIYPQVKKIYDFVFLGRLVSDKGADMAISSIARLMMQNPHADWVNNNFCLTIIGDGPEMSRLKKLAVDLKIESRVSFKGWLKGEALVTCLNQHRFILIPSKWEEPFGNVALEGMACGCVPIVSAGGGLTDAIGNAGLSFKRGDINALVGCMKDVISNPALEDNLRHEAHEHLAKHHPEVISEKYLTVIEAAAMTKSLKPKKISNN